MSQMEGGAFSGQPVLVVQVTDNSAPKHLAGSKDGRSWDFWTQVAYCSSGGEYPKEIEIRLPSVNGTAAPYAPGLYLLGSGTLSAGRKGMFVDFQYALVPIREALEGLGRLVGGVPVRAAARAVAA